MLKKIQIGFSILEVVIAMAIINIALLGVSSLVIQNFQVQVVSRDYLIASMLAQEGLELVRNLRDNNWYTAGANWDDDIYNSGDDTFIIDFDDGPPLNFTPDNIAENGTRLKLNGGFYEYNNGTDTQFHRLLSTVKNIDGSLTVNCRIQWSERGRVHNYTAETLLYDWK